MSLTKRQERHVRTLAALPTDNLGPEDYATLDALVTWASEEAARLDRSAERARGVHKRRQERTRVRMAEIDAWSQDDGYAACDAKSDGFCQHPKGCVERGTEHHHIAGRGGPDPHHPDNLILLCKPHHDYTHAHPRESYRLGTLAKRTGTIR